MQQAPSAAFITPAVAAPAKPHTHEFAKIQVTSGVSATSGQWQPAASVVLPSLLAVGVALKASRRSRKQRARVVVAATATADVDVVKAALAQKQAEYETKRASQRSSVDESELPSLANQTRTNFVGEDELLQIPAVEKGVRASVYAIFAADGGDLLHVGVSRDAQKSLRAAFARRPLLCGDFVVYDVRKPDRSLLEAVKQAWIAENGGAPSGNDGGAEQALWDNPVDGVSADERTEMKSLMPEAAAVAVRAAILLGEERQVQLFEDRGCQEQLLFDAKLKLKGLLELDVGAPAGIRRPEGGVGAAFAVMLRAADGTEVTIECPPDITILDAAEEAGIELPSSCKSGACSACAARVTEGMIDQSDQSYLDDEQMAAGYVMTCCCYPRSDMVIETEKASEVS